MSLLSGFDLGLDSSNAGTELRRRRRVRPGCLSPSSPPLQKEPVTTGSFSPLAVSFSPFQAALSVSPLFPPGLEVRGEEERMG